MICPVVDFLLIDCTILVRVPFVTLIIFVVSNIHSLVLYLNRYSEQRIILDLRFSYTRKQVDLAR